jgi:hypothetical protein
MKTGQMDIGPKRYLYWVEVGKIKTIDRYTEISDWCEMRYGLSGGWFFSDNKVCFYNESDRLIFLLRWA